MNTPHDSVKTPKTSQRALLALCFFALSALVQPAIAANQTWTGGAGGTFNWSDAGNWSPGPLASGDALFFDGSTGLVNSNNLTGTSQTNVSHIVFTSGAGAFNLTGNWLNPNGNLTNLSANLQTISMPLRIANSPTWDVGSAGVLVNSNLSRNASFTITKVGSGTLTLGGVGDNSFCSGNANAGTVVMAKNQPSGTGTHAFNGLTINNNGLVQFDPANTVQSGLAYPQIGNFGGQVNGTITINTGGTLDLNGSSGNNTIVRNFPIGTGGLITNSSATPGTLTINFNADGARVWPGNFGDNPPGTLALQTEGNTANRSNVWSGNIGFNGGMMLNRGTLVFDGPFTGTGATTLGNGSGSAVLIINSNFNSAGGITFNAGTGARGLVLVNNGGVVAGGGTITIPAGETFTINTGGLVADGTMSLTGTLSGGGTNNAVTTVNGGGNVLPGGANTAGTLTTANLSSGGTFTFDLGTATTVGGGVNDLLVVNGDLDGQSGVGTITINPIGALTTNVAYTIIQYTGTYTPGSLNGTVLTGSRYTFTLDDTDTVNKVIKVIVAGSANNLAWNSPSSTAWDINTTGNWTNLTTLVSPDNFFNGDTVLFDESGTVTNIAIATGAAVAPSAITNNSSTKNYTIAGPGKISGAGPLIKQGGSTLTLSAANDFTGLVDVQGGTLVLTNAGPLGSGKNPLSVASGAVVNMTGFNTMVDALTGAGIVDNKYRNTAATFTVGNNNGSGVFTGSITNTTNVVSFTKSGTGMQTLTSMNTYAGQTTINGGGVLAVAAISDTAGASSISTNAVNLNSGTLRYYGSASLTTTRAFNGASATAGIEVSNAAATMTILGQVQNNVPLVKSGAGTLVLGGTGNNANLYVNVAAGTLVLSKTNAAVQTSGVTNVSSGATLRLSGNNSDQLWDNGPVTSMNGLFDLNGKNESITAPSGSGAFRNDAVSTTSTLTVGANNTSGTFSGLIANGSGTVALTKTGSGTVTLTTNTYTGATTISGGALALAAGGSMASSAISLANNTRLDVSAPGGLTLTGAQAISGTGGVIGNLGTSAGTSITPAAAGTYGTLSFSNDLSLASAVLNFDLTESTAVGGGTNDLIQMTGGTLTLSGVTTVNISGTLTNGTYTILQGAGSISGGPANLLANAGSRQTITFDTTTLPDSVLMIVSGGLPASLVWTGTNGSPWNINTTVNWLNAGSPDKFFNADDVLFDDSSTNGVVNIATSVNPGSTTVSNNTRAYAINGVIAGGTVTKDGPGSLTLNGANTYGSATLVLGGTLNLSNNAALGTTVSGTAVTNGGTLNLNGFTPAGEAVTLSGAGVGANGALVNNGASGSTIGTLTLTGDATVGGSAGVTTADFTTVTNALTKTGAGTLAVNWSSGLSYRSVGVLTINQGTVSNVAAEFQATSTNASGQALVLQGGTAFAGNKFTVNNPNPAAIKLVGSGATGATISALQFNAAAGGTIYDVDVDDIGAAAADLTVSGAIAQLNATVAGITKTGPGTLLLNGTGTFSGMTRITNGSITLGSALGLGNSTVDLAPADVGTLNFGSLTAATVGGLTNSRPLGLTNASGAAVNLSVGNGNASSIYSGVLNGSGGITKIGTGVLQLTATNTYTGKTFVSAGTLQIANEGALGTAPGAFTPDQLTLNGGTLFVTNPVPTTYTFGPTRGLTATNGNLAVGGGSTIIWGGPIAGTQFGVNGVGGRVVLTGTNTHDITAVSAGTLQIGNGGTTGTLGTGDVNFAGTDSTLIFARSDSLVVTNTIKNNPGNVLINSGTVNLGGPVDNAFVTVTVNSNATLIMSKTVGNVAGGGGQFCVTLNSANAVMAAPNQIFDQKGVLMANGRFDLGGFDERIGGLVGNGAITNSGVAPTNTLNLNNPSPVAGTPGRDSGLYVTNGMLTLNRLILNVAGPADVAAGAGLAGDASISLGVSATLNNYGTLAPGNGSTIGTLIFSNILGCTLQNYPSSTTIMKLNRAAGTNDQIVMSGTFNFDGTLTVTNVAGSFTGGEDYQLFVGGIGGLFAATNLPPLGSGLSWDTSTLGTDGHIKVTGTLASFSTPAINQFTKSGSNLTLSGTNGTPSHLYYLVTSTNVTTPRSNWVNLLTNNFDASGNFTNTITINAAERSRFFLITTPTP